MYLVLFCATVTVSGDHKGQVAALKRDQYRQVAALKRDRYRQVAA